MGISTHVLDTAAGRPAVGVAVRLEYVDGESYDAIKGVTNADGRVAPLIDDDDLRVGRWRITFATGDYFAARGERSFHPEVAIDFEVQDASEHYHVPLLVTAWSYSTYRGS